MAQVPSILEVGSVHLWLRTPERAPVTLDALIVPEADYETVLHGLRQRLVTAHDLTHATVEVSRHPEPIPKAPA